MKTKMESLTLPAPDKFTDRWLARVQLKPGTNVREVEAFEKGSGAGGGMQGGLNDCRQRGVVGVGGYHHRDRPREDAEEDLKAR